MFNLDKNNEHNPLNQPLTDSELSAWHFKLQHVCLELADRIELDPHACHSQQDKTRLGFIAGLMLNAAGIKPVLELPEVFNPHAKFISESLGITLLSVSLPFNRNTVRLHGLNETAINATVENFSILQDYKGKSAIDICTQINATGTDTPHWHMRYGLLMGFPEGATTFFKIHNAQKTGLHWLQVLTGLGLTEETLEDTASYILNQQIPFQERHTYFHGLTTQYNSQQQIDIEGTLQRFTHAQTTRSYGAGTFVWTDHIASQESHELQAKARSLLDAIEFPYVIPHEYLSSGKPIIVYPDKNT